MTVPVYADVTVTDAERAFEELNGNGGTIQVSEFSPYEGSKNIRMIYDTEAQRICYRRRKKKSFSKTTRMMIYNQADGRCTLYGRKIKSEDMTIDHIRPTALGGSNSVENLQCTC